MAEGEQGLEERNHHALARALHDHAREHHHVIGILGLGVTEGTPQNFRFKQHVGVGE